MTSTQHKFSDALILILCMLWYYSSALSSTSSKSILSSTNFPLSLTLCQFGFVASGSFIASHVRTWLSSLRSFFSTKKNKEVIYSDSMSQYQPLNMEFLISSFRVAVPVSLFQVGGHIFTSLATGSMPVSVVHSIKALSPLFMVLAYRVIYGHRYCWKRYLSLIPLTNGVILACRGATSTEASFYGMIYAFMSMIIFVSQNIFSKKIFSSSHMKDSNQKPLAPLDLLLFSSFSAFILMLPIWYYFEFSEELLSLTLHPDMIGLTFINGMAHFAQNILAFSLLSRINAVTYSIASLMKRVFVIIVSIIWFHQETSNSQVVGIMLTAIGLFIYGQSKNVEIIASAKPNVSGKTAQGKEFEKDVILPLYNRAPSTSSSTLFLSALPYSNSVPMNDNYFTSPEMKRAWSSRAQTMRSPTPTSSSSTSPILLKTDYNSFEPSRAQATA